MKINLPQLAQRPAPLRLGCFICLLLLLWLPLAALIYRIVGERNDHGNLASILTMPILCAEFIFLVKLWGKQVYQQPQIFTDYGLEFSRLNGLDVLRGLAIGFISVLSIFSLQGLLGWLIWQPPQVFLLKIILEGLLISLAVAFGEELFFRGWLLDELQRDYSPSMAQWTNAILFAVAHFIKPLEAIIHTLPQFPALVLLGLTLVWGKRWRRGRLGLPIGLHGGLVWGYYIINVGELMTYSQQVPDWVTGVNKNPLQGVMGVLFMSGLALWMRRRSVKV
ncbi:CPBP family intramembrane glutamic endopeptidase [Cylindrospermum sp. FACHB-282]|uniref:CPBP family intramembrane glutamic endopeptidase n=1 Tax=Cylindrospermum sp. FACHB-282 TaxID=2692794 RepID=UPI0016838BB0|nr:type II CAAX endopeptidase family protein [Cylindrospermum sp. FACHB-282]MBD2386098.1 CPBP family intramembrane metalloprotease [Cylindrospermum sp. FACHB-282]